MPAFEELRYIQAFARIIGVKEDAAIEYAQRKGLNALVDNATQLLTTPVQREKHQAFLDIYRMSSSINTRNPIISSPNDASAFFHSIMEKIYDKEAFVVAFLNTKNRVIDHEVVSVGTINSSIYRTPQRSFQKCHYKQGKFRYSMSQSSEKGYVDILILLWYIRCCLIKLGNT